jgi:ABC-type transport system involved in cytochrome c biogenesis permease subunit
MMSSTTKPTELERKAEEVAVRLVHYRSIRDREPFGPAPLLVTPRPTNPAMLQFSFKSLEKGAPTQGRDLSPLEFESAKNLSQYYEDLDSKDRAEPGTNAKFDAKYSRWLAERSVWVPLGVVLETPTEELGRAGFDTSKVEKFRTAFKAMEAEELTNPGRALEQPAIDLIQAARDLGDTTNDPYYPTIAEMDREVHYNELAPFNKSTVAYGIGFLALMFSLLTTSFGKSVNLESVFGKLAKAFYLAGFVGLASGIAFEGYGFYLRIRITGWAPVTNMAETVIWVGLVSAVLGTVLELIYRRTWSAMAGSGIGLICTALVAAAPLLDPHIKMLPPVLRSNLWLSIHVLTIVSSYAAFALAMGLGLAATSLYLTATYKRSASFVELAMPMVLGLPMLGVGILGSLTYYEWVNPGSIVQVPGFWLGVVIIGSIGGTLTASSLFAMVGESLNRSIFREQLGLDSATSTDDLFLAPASPPIVPPKTDASTATRQLAMQTTAAQIKPIASFIYRSMQVGILLVTAGTFLGGWWADVSWGRFWGWDPKEVWALITLLVYLVPLHGRFAGWVNTFWLVMASVVCFLSVVMAWYGVNFLLGTGLHNYGFTEGAGQGKVGVTLLVVLSFAFGTAWRRMLSQKVVEAVA